MSTPEAAEMLGEMRLRAQAHRFYRRRPLLASMNTRGTSIHIDTPTGVALCPPGGLVIWKSSGDVAILLGDELAAFLEDWRTEP